jgi:hypothetical protein
MWVEYNLLILPVTGVLLVEISFFSKNLLDGNFNRWLKFF